MTLKTQASPLPVRKVAAMIISGAVLGGANAALNIFYPDHPFAPLMAEFDMWIQLLVMAVVGYFVKAREGE